MSSNIINQLYRHLKILSLDLDNAGNNNSGTIDNGPIVVTINSIQKSLLFLQDYYNREMDMEKRSTLKGHVKQIQEEFSMLKERYSQIRSKERINAKEQLLSQRIPSTGMAGSNIVMNGGSPQHSSQPSYVVPSMTTNDHSSISSSYSNSSVSSSLLMNGFRMDGILDIGTSVLDQLKSQRSIIKGTHSKLSNFANIGIGMSNSYIRAIRRRFLQDRMIFWTGIIVTLIIVYLLWKFINK